MSIKPVLVPDHDAAELRGLMDRFAEATTGPTRQQLAESRAAVVAAQENIGEGAPDVMRHKGDRTIRVVKKGGVPIGEIGTDSEASPGNGQYYVKLYDGSYDAVGFDTAEEALAELKYAVKQMSEGVAEGFSRKLNFDEIYGKYLKVTDNNGDPNKEGFSLVTPLNGASWNWRERPEFKELVKRRLNEPGFLGDYKYKQIIDSMAGKKFDPAHHLAKGVEEGSETGIGSKLPKSDIETFGLQKGRPYKINPPQDFKPGDRKRAVQQLIPTQDKKDHIRSRLGKHVAPALPESDMAENNPVVNAITRRIMLQRTDLLSKYGPELVGQAIDEVADFVGDVEEIGSSDVSGWIRHVEQMLGNMEQDVAEQTAPVFKPGDRVMYLTGFATVVAQDGDAYGIRVDGKPGTIKVPASQIRKPSYDESVAESIDPIEQLRADIRRFAL